MKTIHRVFGLLRTGTTSPNTIINVLHPQDISLERPIENGHIAQNTKLVFVVVQTNKLTCFFRCTQVILRLYSGYRSKHPRGDELSNWLSISEQLNVNLWAASIIPANQPGERRLFFRNSKIVTLSAFRSVSWGNSRLSWMSIGLGRRLFE